MGGMVDTSEFFRQASFPRTRLHDCQWPEPAVVDIHTIFRDFRQDATVPENYYFVRTDDYLQSIRKTGTRILYRLGESIEHSQRKYDVHPPADYEKWAQICLGIIRHYNEGWANGFHHDIDYWEIWNEPEVRPQMWSGSDEDYYRLYSIVAKAIKKEFPRLKVGGPAAASAGSFNKGRLEPTPFLAGFFQYCRQQSAPLDFFSWHVYSSEPGHIVRLAAGVRQMLDSLGFSNTESHLDEWNYLPHDDWNIFSHGTASQRAQWYAEMTGPAGAAFTACILLELQDIPLDMAYYYTSEPQGFGLFGQYGEAHAAYYAIKAFNQMLDTPMRLPITINGEKRISVIAGTDESRSRVNLLLSNFQSAPSQAKLRLDGLSWNTGSLCRFIRISKEGNWNETASSCKPNEDLPVELSPDEVLLIKLTSKGD